jgi:hypothetical protein
VSAVGYDAQRAAVLAFLSDPGDGYGVDTDGRASFTVKAIAHHERISETRAGDILVGLERAGELMRAKHGRAFVYWRPSSPVPSPEATPHADGDGTASHPDDRSPAEYLDDVAAALRAGEAVPTRAPVAMDIAGHEALSEANLRGMFPDDVAASLALLRKIGGKAYCGAQDDEQRKTIEMAAALHLEAEGLVRLVSRRSYTVAELVDVAG